MKRLIMIVGLVTAIVITTKAQNSETRSLSSFDGVKASESINVVLVPGNKNEALVETSRVDTKDVITDVRGGTLYIEMDKGNYRSISVDVRVTYADELTSVRASSSSRVESKGVIKSDELEVKASSSARIGLDVDVKKLKVDVSSSGRVDLSGAASTQVVEASSSGRYGGYEVDSQGVKADVSSSGRVEVSVSKEIYADASSSGRVSYKGNPDKVIADTSSSGRVNKAD